MDNIKQRRIILIDKYYNLLAGLLINLHDQIEKPHVRIRRIAFDTKAFFIVAQDEQ